MSKFGPKPRAAIERFTEKVAIADSNCLVWMASTDSKGYGKFQGESGHSGRLVPAHRWSYEYFVGPIPNGLHLDHLCRNRTCVNPAHLEPVTQQVNILRGVGLPAVNAAKTHCPVGHAYSDENTYINATSGSRTCRECRREHDRRRRPGKGI